MFEKGTDVPKDVDVVKIKEYRIRLNGRRGMVITLPKVWVDDKRLSPGDTLEIFRDIDGRLIIQAKDSCGKLKLDQASELREQMRKQS